MTDRELLELAAKAAGIALKPLQINNVTKQGDDRFIGYLMTDAEQWPRGWFNPLTDDGDALRLAVKLGMERIFCLAWFEDCAHTGFEQSEVAAVKFDGDPYAATRRAIVRAAAEVGRAME